MSDTRLGGTFQLGSRRVHRMGFGAMQLAGPGVFGPPRDRPATLAVLREAIALGIDHIDTSDFYGPHLVNEAIGEALAPYPESLVLVTKLGARRDGSGAWLEWNSPEALEQGLRDNLEHLGLPAMEVVNLRLFTGHGGPREGSVRPFLEPLIRLKDQGLIEHIGISTATRTQVAEARGMTEIVCVQNHYNLAHREDDALIDELAAADIAYVPYFPLGGFNPLQSDALSSVAAGLGITPMQTALAWLLRRAPNILLIPGTSSLGHLRENVAAADIDLPDRALAQLDAIGA